MGVSKWSSRLFHLQIRTSSMSTACCGACTGTLPCLFNCTLQSHLERRASPWRWSILVTLLFPFVPLHTLSCSATCDHYSLYASDRFATFTINCRHCASCTRSFTSFMVTSSLTTCCIGAWSAPSSSSTLRALTRVLQLLQVRFPR